MKTQYQTSAQVIQELPTVSVVVVVKRTKIIQYRELDIGNVGGGGMLLVWTTVITTQENATCFDLERNREINRPLFTELLQAKAPIGSQAGKTCGLPPS